MPTYPSNPTTEAPESGYTPDDLSQIDTQIRLLSTGKSVAEYEVGGRRLKFRDLSLDDLQRLRRTVETALKRQSGKKRIRYSLISTSKGF